MSDVREASAPTMGAAGRPRPHGDPVWYELMTPDPEGAKAFYDAVVGWNIGEGAQEYQGYRMIESEGGNAGGVFPLTADMQEQGARLAWLGYIGVEDVDRAVASIEQAGGKALMPAFDIPNVGRIAMVADPQGAPFYIMKPIPPADRPDAQRDVFSSDKRGRCSWNELSTSDPVAARRFYGELFGWTSDDFMPMDENGEYHFFDHRGTRLGAVSGLMGGERPHWRYYFRMPSVGKARETAEAKGGKIAMGPMEVPGGDHIIIGIDPQGAEFALVGKA